MRVRAIPCRAVAAGVVALSLAASAAHADSLRGTVGSVGERAVTVDVRVDRGDATLVVRRTLVSGGERADQAVLAIDAPAGGVAVGLRTLAAGGWITGELMEAERAEKRYRELTGFGPAAPRDPVLLSWAGAGALTLQAFPVAPGADRTVEYTLRVPAEWREGRWHVTLPAMGTGDASPEAVVRAGDAHDTLAVDGATARSGIRVTLDRAVDVSLLPSAQPRLGAALAVLPLGPARTLVHARVEAAAHLSELPHGAWVVVLVDASRSLDEADLSAELAAARAYVSWLPDARFAVLAFDRQPRPLVPSFLDARGAADALASARIVRRNGSHLDAALVEATRLLSAAPAGAPRRILALTDLRLRRALTPEAALDAVAGSGAVVHLASVRPGEPLLARDDDGAWSLVPRGTGGVLWNAGASADPDREPAMHRVFEEWARPVRVDRLAVTLPGAPGQSLDAATLDEGAGLDDTRITAAAPDALKVDGELWSRPVHLTAVRSDDEAQLWSSLVFGTALASDLKDPEIRALARRGRAVTPLTSYLAVEPGARPSTEGLAEAFGHGSGSGGGSYSTHCGGIGYSHRATIDAAAVLAAAIAPAWRRCNPRGARGHLAVETTSLEIVDVPLATVEAPASEGMAECLREAAWAIDVPEELRPLGGVWSIEL